MISGRFEKKKGGDFGIDSFETFIPDPKGAEYADTHGKVAAVWRTMKGNLFHVYRRLLNYICVVGSLASICCIVICAWLTVVQLSHAKTKAIALSCHRGRIHEVPAAAACGVVVALLHNHENFVRLSIFQDVVVQSNNRATRRFVRATATSA